MKTKSKSKSVSKANKPARRRSIQKDAETGRSLLVNLTKEQIVETIVASMPLTAYTFVAPLLAKKGLKLKQSIFLENSVAHLDQRAKALMSLPRATLVDVAYDYCDTRLNNLNPGSRHRTTPTERRTDVRRKAFVLKKERALDLGKSKWATEWRKRDKTKYRANVEKVIRKVAKAAAAPKKAPTIRLSREPLTRRQSKSATRNWIASMRQHNAVITSQSEPIFKSVEI